MGSSNFFSKFASIDPIAQSLHLPGSQKYREQEMQDANSTGSVGPYAGVTPTLAGANGGYAPGGPGANASYTPFHAQMPGGLFGDAQRLASATAAASVNPAGGKYIPGTPQEAVATYRTGVPQGEQNNYAPAAGTQDLYATAAQQAAMNPSVNVNNLFAKPLPNARASQPTTVWGG